MSFRWKNNNIKHNVPKFIMDNKLDGFFPFSHIVGAMLNFSAAATTHAWRKKYTWCNDCARSEQLQWLRWSKYRDKYLPHFATCEHPKSFATNVENSLSYNFNHNSTINHWHLTARNSRNNFKFIVHCKSVCDVNCFEHFNDFILLELKGKKNGCGTSKSPQKIHKYKFA